MKLISCNECGIVYDGDKLLFSDDCRKYKNSGEVDEEKFTYVDHLEEYKPFVNCPVCGEKIVEE